MSQLDMRWTSLPAEIRSMILEIVAEDYRFKSEQKYVRAGYASVCREWQLVFEQKNFQRIVLDQDRISDLEQFMATGQRREYLKHLILRVRLNDYDCTVCQSKEDDETIRNNNDTFSKAVWKLLVILSKWTGVAESRRQQGLILELGACSPSDSKHTFRDFHLEDDYPYQEKKDLEIRFDAYRLRADRLGLDNLHDPDHGWVHGRREGVSLEAKQRIMGTLTLKPKLSRRGRSLKFPKANIVTGLLIRPQFYRKMAVSSLGKLLRDTFTCLQWFRHEAWHDVDPQKQSRFEKNCKRLISMNLPSTLQSLYIFEDFNEVLHPERIRYARTNSSLDKALSKSSRFLENLSVAFLVDAKDFFADFWPNHELQNSNLTPWENLRKLALTASWLRPKIERGRLNNLLMAAGRAAAFMPKLELMEIWNGGEGHVSVFRYSNDAGKPQITWRSNYKVELDHNVVNCWANLPRHGEHPHGNLTVTVDRIPRMRKQVKTYASTVLYGIC